MFAEYQLQRLTLLGNALQIEVRVGGAQVVGHRAGHAYRDPFIIAELLKIHRHRPTARPNDQLRHTHVRIAEQPQAQAGRCLGQAWRQIDLTSHQRPLQRGLIREVTPGQVQPQRTTQPVHQLDVDPIQLLQATVELGKRCLQHQPDPQAAVLLEPLLLRRVENHSGRRACRDRPSDQGPAQTADNQQAAQ
ncbi:hypothetical protein D3C77_163420 [compost metagenome]